MTHSNSLVIIKRLLLLMVVLTIPTSITSQKHNIGLIMLLEDDMNEISERSARLAIAQVNGDSRNFSVSLSLDLAYVSKSASVLSLRRAVCQLLERGVTLLIVPDSLLVAEYVTSLADHKAVPVLSLQSSPLRHTSLNAIELQPSWPLLSQVLVDVVRSMNWSRMVILYEDNDGLLKLQKLIQYVSQYSVQKSQPSVEYKVLRLPSSGDFRYFMRQFGYTGETKFVVDISIKHIDRFLKHTQMVGMMTSHYSYFFTLLNFHTLNLDDFRFSGCNFTALSLLEPDTGNVPHLMSRRRDRQSHWHLTPPTTSQITTEAALIYDGIILFARTVQDMGLPDHSGNDTWTCEAPGGWRLGETTINFLKTSSVEGLTGTVAVNGRGVRSDFSISVVQLVEQGLVTMGHWSRGVLELSPDYGTGRQDLSDRTDRVSLHLVVSTILKPPYTMMKSSSVRRSGNDRYEGICVDLMETLSARHGFNYSLLVNADNTAGKLSATTQRWSGMIGDLLAARADLAIADLTITKSRTKVVNFTIQWMSLGISLMYVQPERSPSLFTFLSPFSSEVWIYLVFTIFCVSGVMFFIARLSPCEWRGYSRPGVPYGQPSDCVSAVTLANSCWFCTGSLMQQGSDIVPRAVSTRLLAATWWAFTLIMVSSYTANLAAFLTIETVVPRLSSAEDLLRPENGDIQFGFYQNGSTAEFFRNSKVYPYDKIWRQSQGERGLLQQKDELGVDRVSNSKGGYAYFMESSSIDYYVARHCELAKIGALLDNKGYGIAVRPGSPVTAEMLSETIIELQEKGKLQEWKVKWWKGKSGETCEESSKKQSERDRLNLRQVGGVFLCLVSGLGVATLCGVIQLACNARKIAKQCRTSWQYELCQEMRVSLCHTRRVCRFCRPVTVGCEVSYSIGAELDKHGHTDTDRPDPSSDHHVNI